MTPDQWSAIANLITAAAAAVASGAAVWGINSWRKQEVWKQDNDLAKRLMIVLGRYEHVLFAVRNPLMLAEEMEITEPKIEELAEVDLAAKRKMSGYQRRWQKVWKEQNELDALLLEAKAVWGNEIKELFQSIESLHHELWECIYLYLEEVRDSHSKPLLAKQYREMRLKNRDILYEVSRETDEFRKDFKKAIKSVENFLIKKIGRRR